MRLLIVGGSDAGISAALRVREIAPEVEVTVVLADNYPNFSICGLPFFLSGETPDWRRLAHRTEFAGIELLRNTIARRLLLDEQKVEVENCGGLVRQMHYDRLVVATGARPATPRIEGLHLDGVFCLHTMNDSFRVHERLNGGASSAVLVGSGYIGLEMADALVHRGLKVTLIGRSHSLLASADEDLGRVVQDELMERGVAVHWATAVTGIEEVRTLLRVHCDTGATAEGDLVIVATGVTPNSELARDARIPLGHDRAIRVDRRMETERANVFAAGDCAETWHRVLQRNTYLPLGTTSHKQGRTAGENAVGGDRRFEGTLGTQIVKVFDLAIGRTGLREPEAKNAGFSPMTLKATGFDHKAYYPGAKEVTTKITGDAPTGCLLGGQMIGNWQASIAKRIDIFAIALFNGMTVDGLSDLDLSYTPPLGSPWDVVQSAAQSWSAAQRDLLKGEKVNA
jgi:NADPH-dependent 2,4-dienoyl-CoA reductase/sulfur reductase-like enzyme